MSMENIGIQNIRKSEATPERKVTVEDEVVFGIFLSTARQRINKSHSQIGKELGLRGSNSYKWENDFVLPDEKRLGAIAQVYGVNLEELKRVFKIAEEARDLAKEIRRPHVPKKLKPNMNGEEGHEGGSRGQKTGFRRS